MLVGPTIGCTFQVLLSGSQTLCSVVPPVELNEHISACSTATEYKTLDTPYRVFGDHETPQMRKKTAGKCQPFISSTKKPNEMDEIPFKLGLTHTLRKVIQIVANGKQMLKLINRLSVTSSYLQKTDTFWIEEN